MPEMNGNGNSDRFEWEGFGMKIKGPGKRSAELIAAMSLLLSFAIGGAFWLHRAEANEGVKEIKSAIKDGNAAQLRVLKAMLKQQVFQSCIQQFEDKEKPSKIQICRDLSKQAVVDTE